MNVRDTPFRSHFLMNSLKGLFYFLYNKNSLSILLKEKRKKGLEKMEKLNLSKDKGITILLLTITINILLILAGITIAGLTGKNGLIKNAGQAKEETEISNEKEILERATATTMGKDRRGNIEEENLVVRNLRF